MTNMIDEILGMLGRPADDDSGDWHDVMRRARRGRRRRLAVIAASLAAASAVAAPALSLVPTPWHLHEGKAVSSPLSSHDRFVISVIGRRIATNAAPDMTSVRLLGSRNGFAFYSIRFRGRSAQLNGTTCYSSGRTGQSFRFGGYLCASRNGGFPSAGRPILDMSVVEGLSKTAHQVRIVRLSGVAADAVAKVGILTSDGAIRAVTPVVGNIYVGARDLPAEAASGVVAFDAAGHRLYTQCYVTAGCD